LATGADHGGFLPAGPVLHILDARRCEPHEVTEFARLDGDVLRYDAGTQLALAVFGVD
jgi:hypothetical protein